MSLDALAYKLFIHIRRTLVVCISWNTHRKECSTFTYRLANHRFSRPSPIPPPPHITRLHPTKRHSDCGAHRPESATQSHVAVARAKHCVPMDSPHPMGKRPEREAGCCWVGGAKALPLNCNPRSNIAHKRAQCVACAWRAIRHSLHRLSKSLIAKNCVVECLPDERSAVAVGRSAAYGSSRRKCGRQRRLATSTESSRQPYRTAPKKAFSA